MPMSFCGRSRPPARSRMHYGKLLLHTNQLQAALAQFEIVLQQNPRSAEALLAGGMAYLEQENLPEALERLTRALALDPQNDRARLHIADVHIAQGDADSAAAVLGEVASPGYYLDVEIRFASVIAQRGRHCRGDSPPRGN